MPKEEQDCFLEGSKKTSLLDDLQDLILDVCSRCKDMQNRLAELFILR